MIAADRPIQRSPDAKLLIVDADGAIRHARRSLLSRHLQRGDLVIANDAATLPASLHGVHVPSGQQVEVRLAGRSSLAPERLGDFTAIVFGAGDYHTRTEHRAAPPALRAGDRLALGALDGTIVRALDHPRLVRVHFEGKPAELLAGLAKHGRPIQYTHVAQPLELWDVWTSIAGPPVAYEPPSAGYALDWAMLLAFANSGIEFATITHAAGISSTGDPDLDRRLPFDEPYHIPESTARSIRRAQREGRRVVAIGTTVVRALEDAAARSGIVLAGEAVATQRIGAATRLHVVTAVLSGTHEPGSSHYELLRAFASDATLHSADQALDVGAYRTHEFGDSVLITRDAARYSRSLDPVIDGTCAAIHEGT
jgi:S-adenosylmethionine:tRNA ribosyltransferase-isomerase